MPAPEFGENGNDRILAVAAWSLVAVAMFLALLVLIAGYAGAYVAAHPPVVPPITSTPVDSIYPPKSLQRPCNPIFQRCEVAP